MQQSFEIISILPTMGEKLYETIFDVKTGLTKDTYSDLDEKREIHQTCSYLIQILYHLGAKLINNGQAYSKEADLLYKETGILYQDKRFQDIPFDKSALSFEQVDNHQKLILLYNEFPKTTEASGSHGNAINVERAIFVTKVALDHIRRESIYEIYRQFTADAKHLTGSGHNLSLPNGSSYLSFHSASIILGLYIEENLHEFKAILPNKTIIKESTHFLSGIEDDKKVKEIFGRDIKKHLKSVARTAYRSSSSSYLLGSSPPSKGSTFFSAMQKALSSSSTHKDSTSTTRNSRVFN